MAHRILGWLVLVPLSILLVVFALANRQFVVLNFNPLVTPQELSAPDYGVPLFVVLYVVLLLGVLMGGVATWFAQGRHRQRERHWRREAKTLGDELEALRRTQRSTVPLAVSEVDDVLELR